MYIDIYLVPIAKSRVVMAYQHQHQQQQQPPIPGPGSTSGGGGGAGFHHLNLPFGDTTFTKVFVGGLAWETQSETMRRYFEQFGDILEAVVITDKNTGRSKGYGFVSVPFLFSTFSSVYYSWLELLKVIIFFYVSFKDLMV